MPNGSSEGVKVNRWKPVFRSARLAEGIAGKKGEKVKRPPRRRLPDLVSEFQLSGSAT
jgi:hypothetical protein